MNVNDFRKEPAAAGNPDMNSRFRVMAKETVRRRQIAFDSDSKPEYVMRCAIENLDPEERVWAAVENEKAIDELLDHLDDYL